MCNDALNVAREVMIMGYPVNIVVWCCIHPNQRAVFITKHWKETLLTSELGTISSLQNQKSNDLEGEQVLGRISTSI